MRTLRSLLVLQPHRIAIVARPRGSDWLSDDIQNRSQKVVEVLVPLLTPEDYSPMTSAALASKSGSSNMPGLEALKDNCNDSAETCWRRFLKEHGRKFVQDQWLATWNANKGSCLLGTSRRGAFGHPRKIAPTRAILVC